MMKATRIMSPPCRHWALPADTSMRAAGRDQPFDCGPITASRLAPCRATAGSVAHCILRSGIWREKTGQLKKRPELRMAELVAGIGVPHSPHYPAQIAKDAPHQTARLF